MNADCLFCKIIAKHIPADIIYEDDVAIAFLDIKPVNPGHFLVVPKQHSEGFHDADPKNLAGWITAAQTVANAMTKALGVEAFNLMQNNGAIAGQVVPHLHLHVIPRHAGDGRELWHGTPASQEERADIAEKLRNVLR